ncbi:hypothetical protein SPRG_19645 [Saprolegnia parasitica CBS 223.65]|uniref:Uncharacterized protein n=1 Tax=Saprolegnia parasitica (strain CBS 223.65) TaxID=695850 RepID=A0A067CV64_SAPPC|nr:hypothetical protein SPRG_19645 [Saprolegnia parasitica CBS 223.65]KDO30421.1 hypothetical protein SPRG_19645 [Saprolegnia parasitica CBS 223.65]|eukprot:XP_012198874.1 hypothetical protein SPRG_19645 [Saprolegnia parasitica CBS 223.65]
MAATTAALEPCAGQDVGMAIMDAMTSLEANACGRDTGNDNLLMNVWTHEQALQIEASANCAQFWTLLSNGVKNIDDCIYDATTGMSSSQYAAMTFQQFAADLVASTTPSTPSPTPNATVNATHAAVPHIFY